MSIELTETEKEDMLKCLGESAFRLPAEFFLVRDNCLPPEFIENPFYNEVRRPIKWRLKAWKILLNTAFKGVAEMDRSKSVEAASQVIGLFQSASGAARKMDKEEEELLEQALSKIPDKGIDLENAAKNLKKLTKLLDKDRSRTLVERDSPGELGTFFKNYGMGLDLIGHVDGAGNVQFTNQTPATPIYLFLILFGDMLQKQPTVKRVYEIYCLDNDEDPAHFDDSQFKKICSSLGFTGASYRRRKKRLVRP